MAKFDWNKSIKIAPPYAAQRALLDGMPQKWQNSGQILVEIYEYENLFIFA